MPSAGRPNFSAVGRIERKAAPKKEPIREPSPPMMTMNRMLKDRRIENTSAASPPPYQRKIIIAPATPQK